MNSPSGICFFFFFFFLTVRPSDDCDKKNVFSSRDIDYNPQRIVRITNTKLHTGQSHLVTDSANKNVKRPSTTCDALQLAWKYCRRCHIQDRYYDENRKIQCKSLIVVSRFNNIDTDCLYSNFLYSNHFNYFPQVRRHHHMDTQRMKSE